MIEDCTMRPGASTHVPVETILSNSNVLCSRLNPDTAPLFIEPLSAAFQGGAAFYAWLEENRAILDDLIVQYGGIVLRGFPIASPEDFDRVAVLFSPRKQGYVGGWSPRETVTGNVMESTRMAQELRLPIHSEMFYMRDYPSRIAFYCQIAADEGGETIIADLRDVSRRMPPALRAKLEALGVRHARNYAAAGKPLDKSVGNSDDMPWDIGFSTDDQAEVERLCASMALEPIWNEDGSLTVVNHVEPFATHPVTGQSLYRSGVHSGGRSAMEEDTPEQARLRRQAFPTGTTLGDGSRLTDEEIATIKGLIDDATIGWRWQAGDVMLLDNIQIGHGRNPYKGERKVLAAILD